VKFRPAKLVRGAFFRERTARHQTDLRQCGFAGCVDLRPWAKTNRYCFQLEESYQVESDGHVKGDRRWFVEIVCRRGLIYPFGGLDLVAFTESIHGWRELLKVEGVGYTQESSGEFRCRFPIDRLDEVAAILKPKRLPGVSRLTDEHREKLKPYAFQGRKTA
jgi:hypothetical protein